MNEFIAAMHASNREDEMNEHKYNWFYNCGFTGFSVGLLYQGILLKDLKVFNTLFKPPNTLLQFML